MYCVLLSLSLAVLDSPRYICAAQRLCCFLRIIITILRTLELSWRSVRSPCLLAACLRSCQIKCATSYHTYQKTNYTRFLLPVQVWYVWYIPYHIVASRKIDQDFRLLRLNDRSRDRVMRLRPHQKRPSDLVNSLSLSATVLYFLLTTSTLSL